MSFFHPNKPINQFLLWLSVIVSLIIGILGIIQFDKTSDIKIEVSNERPNLVFSDKPKIISIKYKIDNLDFPRRLTSKRYLREISKFAPIKSEQENILFKKNDESKTEKTIVLNSDNKLNLDSLNKTVKINKIVKAVPFFTFSVKIKNIGKKLGKILFVCIADSNSTEPFLRNKIYNQSITDSSNFILSDFDEFEKIDLLPDSVNTFTFDNNSLNILDESSNIFFHILVIYKDSNNKFYDSYYVGKYKMLNPDYSIIPQPLYEETQKGIYELNTVVLHYLPQRPKISDLLLFINDKESYDKELSTIEIKNLIR